MLHYPFVFTGGLYTLAAFVNIVAAWLLDVYVFSGLACPDRRKRVPVIGRGNRNRVDALVFQKFAYINITFHRCVAVLKSLGFTGKYIFVYITQCRQPHTFHPIERSDMRAAPSVDSDHCHSNVVIRPSYTGKWTGHRKTGTGRNRTFHKISACENFHGLTPSLKITRFDDFTNAMNYSPISCNRIPRHFQLYIQH